MEWVSWFFLVLVVDDCEEVCDFNFLSFWFSWGLLLLLVELDDLLVIFVVVVVELELVLLVLVELVFFDRVGKLEVLNLKEMLWLVL